MVFRRNITGPSPKNRPFWSTNPIVDLNDEEGLRKWLREALRPAVDNDSGCDSPLGHSMVDDDNDWEDEDVDDYGFGWADDGMYDSDDPFGEYEYQFPWRG